MFIYADYILISKKQNKINLKSFSYEKTCYKNDLHSLYNIAMRK
jgi:hypothetical protein